MDEENRALHYVCRHEEARELIVARDRFWVCDCGCRVGRGSSCSRSRIDVCLQFTRQTAAAGDPREISRAEAEAVLNHAIQKGLVARPFRGWEDRSVTEGICFCCDDCCGYFLNREERCDKGAHIEMTDMGKCNDCGACVEPCHFGARGTSPDGMLALHREECYGCGLCAEACPLECIAMVPREAGSC